MKNWLRLSGVLLLLGMLAFASNAQEATPTPTDTPTINNLEITSIEQIEGTNSIEVIVSYELSSNNNMSVEFRVTSEEGFERAYNSKYLEASSSSMSFVFPLTDGISEVAPDGNYVLSIRQRSETTPLAQGDFSFVANPPTSIEIVRLEYIEGSNQINLSVSGNFTPDAGFVYFYLKPVNSSRTYSLYQESASAVLLPLASNDITLQSAYGSTYNRIPEGEYTLLAHVYTNSNSGVIYNNIIVTASSETFQFTAPYITISSLVFEEESNSFIAVINSNLSAGNLIRLSVSNTVTCIDETCPEVSEQVNENGQAILSLNMNDILPSQILNPFNALFNPILSNALYLGVSTEIEHEGETISLAAQEYRSYTFTPFYTYWFYARYYWYITIPVLVVLLLFIAYIVFRQWRWVNAVGFAPLALFPPQRNRAVNKRAKTWENISDIESFVRDVRTVDFISRNATRRVQNLREATPGIEVLENISKEIQSLNSEDKGFFVKPLKHYENHYQKRLASLLAKEKQSLIADYWHLTELAAQNAETLKLPDDEATLESIATNLDKTLDGLRHLQKELQPFLPILTRAFEFESVQYLNEIIIDLNQHKENRIENDIQSYDASLERFLARIEAYLKALPKKPGTYDNAPMVNKDWESAGFVLKKAPYGNNVHFANQPHPLHALLEALQANFQSLREQINQFRLGIKQSLKNALDKISSIEEIPQLEQVIDNLPANRYGGNVDSIISELQTLTAEVASALSQTPQSYGRRLTLQDAHVAIRDLQARLRGEEPELASRLQAIAKFFEERKRSDEAEEKKTYDNPYITGNPLRARNIALFKGRANLASDVVNRLRGKRNSTLLLYGARRMGKSSFLYHLENLLPASYISVFVDCQGATTQNEVSFFYQLAKSIYDVLRKKDPVAIREVTRPREEFYKESPSSQLEDWLKDSIAPILGKRILLITLDEFEEIGNAIREGRMGKGVLGQLRHMIQHSEYLTFMFAGVATLDALVENAASYFISVSAVELSYLDNAAAEALILRPYQSEDVATENLEEGNVPPYEGDAVQELMRLTRNQPFLTQALCEQLVNLANEEQLDKITRHDVERVANLIDREYPNYFEFYWNNWGKTGHQIFASIIKQDALPNGAESQAVLADLQRHHVLEAKENGTYAIEVPLMEQFIRKRLA